tara:strand:- start:232 stop:828 length:597 start_codon:yes stop_codon:yes gene_type:complete
MKNIFLILAIISFSTLVKAQGEISDDKPSLPNTMFSVEGGYQYNGFIKKQSVGVKAYVWFLKRNSIGPEFHIYFPTQERDYVDYQFDFNFRRILVDFHPLTFDVLIGPAFRNTKDAYDTNHDYIKDSVAIQRDWIFDGVNIGFGVGYRKGDHSMYFMPKINSSDSQIQLSLGYKFHFDPFLNRLFNRKYKLRKKRKKN